MAEHSNKSRRLTARGAGSSKMSMVPSPETTPVVAVAAVPSSEMCIVKREVEDVSRNVANIATGSSSATATAAAAAAAAIQEPQSVGMMASDLFHCKACLLPLKPPVFLHEVGFVCGACGGGGSLAGALRCPHMDAFVDTFKVPCPYAKFGCLSSVVYHESADHKDVCAYAPCHCSLCSFEGAPPALLAHLAADHRWPVDGISYGKVLVLRLPATEQLRLLKAVDERVFLLAVGAHGKSRFAVAVVCLRGNDGGKNGLRYKCTMWADGPLRPESGVEPATMVQEMVENRAAVPCAPGATVGQLGVSMLPTMLHPGDGESKEIHVRIRIDPCRIILANATPQK